MAVVLAGLALLRIRQGREVTEREEVTVDFSWVRGRFWDFQSHLIIINGGTIIYGE